jgi:hypothetical protein
VSATLVRFSGIESPVRASGFLAPASRYSASAATGTSLLRSVGRPVQVLREGRLATAAGFTVTRSFPLPPPIGRLAGRLFESADAFWLPLIWPELRTVDFYVDTRVPGLNALMGLAARRPWLKRLMERRQSGGRALARWFGSKTGCVGVEIEPPDGQATRMLLMPRDHGHRIAVAPAVMAVVAIAHGRFAQRGLILPDQHVDPAELMSYLARQGVELRACRGPPLPA